MKQMENMKIWTVWNHSYNATYCSCSCLVNCIYEYFTATDWKFL